MDEQSKQKIAELKYKQLRDQPPQEYKGDYKSAHYKEVKNPAAISAQVIAKEKHSTEYKEDFDKAAKDFWQKNTQSGVAKYNGGSLTANFGREEYSLNEFLIRVGKFIKESITNELIEKKLPVEDLSENFKAVEIALKLLADSTCKLDDNIDIVNMTAYLHGFINTYVTSTIQRKIERDKGNVQV